MITQQEQKQIERVFKKPISEIEELSIPTYIRNRENTETLEEEAERIKSETAYEEQIKRAKAKELAIEYLIHERDCEEVLEKWKELHGAVQDEDEGWQV